MSLILNGTDGLSDVDGTAATPAIRGTDTNTGIFFPAADTIAFSEGGAEAMRIDSAGNVGIGVTPNTWTLGKSLSVGDVGSAVFGFGGYNALTSGSYFNSGWKYSSSSSSQKPALINISDGEFVFSNAVAGTAGNAITFSERMRIDSSGNVGIGNAVASTINGQSDFANLVVGNGSGTEGITVYTGTSSEGALAFADGTSSTDTYRGLIAYNHSNNSMAFRTDATERMRIDSSGNLLVGTTDPAETTGVGIKFIQGTSLPIIRTALNRGDTAGVNTFLLYNTNATNNGYRFYVNVNGGISNFSGNNLNLSDNRSKKNIEIAGSYLDKICSIPVKLFNYKEEADGEQRTLGVIAQDVEAVAPEFVNSSDWLEKEQKYDSPLKSVYTTDLMFGMMKAIQEQQALIQNLTTRLTALEGK